MIVVKIGGSLFDSPFLKKWLEVLSKQITHNIVIVPGGGPFADQVRTADMKWNLPQQTSHEMAVLGMQQYAHMMQGLQNDLSLLDSIEQLPKFLSPKQTIIWSPYHDVSNTSGLVKEWETTSDTIALWLAIKLNADQLFLIKSANVENLSVSDLKDSNIVDKNFQPLLTDYSGMVEFIHATAFNEFFSKINS